MNCLQLAILKNYNRKYMLTITQIASIIKVFETTKNTYKIDASISIHKLENHGRFYMYLCDNSTLRASQVFSRTSDNVSWMPISVRLLSVITQADYKVKICFSY